jgi:pyridoxal phosphate enzyme (YggS family)
MKMNQFEHISQNLREVREKIAAAAAKVNRKADEITLVAVSKTHPAEAIRVAIDHGVDDIGESRVQEASPKIEALGRITRWHMIGHLQTNKVKTAVKLFDIIQSVDSRHLAKEIDRRSGEIDKKMECLVEINSSGEESKYGVKPDEMLEFLKRIGNLENICLRGLMTVGPWTEDRKLIGGAFRKTRELFIKGQDIIGERFNILSMGMSDDYEMAIAEGSNLVRVGTAIFGSRRKI